MDRRLLDYTPVLEILGSSEFEREAERAAQAEARPFDEGAEFALAAELLSVRGEADLEAFLSEVIARAASNGTRLAGAPLGQALVRLLKRAAQPILQPLRRGVLAAAVPRLAGNQPGIARAAQIFGLELEGLSPEDKEFALARQFVRFAGNAAANAVRLKGSPETVAAAAVRAAARDEAPGLVPRIGAPARHGRWVRRDGQIVVIDC